jgi:hypothetical protein
MDQKEIIRLRSVIARFQITLRTQSYMDEQERIEVSDLALQWFKRYTTMDIRRYERNHHVYICSGDRKFQLSEQEIISRAEQWLKEWSDYNMRLAAEQRNK